MNSDYKNYNGWSQPLALAGQFRSQELEVLFGCRIRVKCTKKVASTVHLATVQPLA